MNNEEMLARLERLEYEGVYAPLAPGEYAENLQERVAIQSALGYWGDEDA